MVPKQYLDQFCGSKGMIYCPYFRTEGCKRNCDTTEESQKEFKRGLEEISQNQD